jgi:hypothetical protein
MECYGERITSAEYERRLLMSVLTLDLTSAKTLPALDKLFSDSAMDRVKFAQLISKTTGAPLRRLMLASLSRHSFEGQDQAELGDVSKLMESLISTNLRSDNEKEDEVYITDLLHEFSDETVQVMLFMSIARYNTYDLPAATQADNLLNLFVC